MTEIIVIHIALFALPKNLQPFLREEEFRSFQLRTPTLTAAKSGTPEIDPCFGALNTHTKSFCNHVDLDSFYNIMFTITNLLTLINLFD